jgi:hypothetical protein
MTQPGIGGGGLMGLAVEVMPPPVLTGIVAAGGALTAGAYKYRITAINANGETDVSNEVTVTTATTNLTAHLTWPAVSGATGYKIYRTAAAGATNTELLRATVGAVLLYDDVAVGVPAGAMPTFNSATNYGTYTAPTKFFPFNNESLKFDQATVWRRPIRQSVDVLSGVAGNVHINGDIEMEALEDIVPYFLLSSRVAAVKTVNGSDIEYTFTPTPAAVPVLSLSLTVVRNEEVFGYTGCVVSQFTFTPADGLLMFNVSIIGSDETEQASPSPVYTTTDPYGAGQYEVSIAGTQVFDTDTFEFMVNDNAEPQFRLKNTGRGAQYVKFGERETTITAERDFFNRDEYDDFKTLTEEAIFIRAEKSATNFIQVTAPVSIKNTYEVGLSGQGDLVRASLEYMNVIDGSGDSFSVEIGTQENIALVSV